MWALTFASYLDKSKGLDDGSTIGLSYNKNGELMDSSLINQSMGMMM